MAQKQVVNDLAPAEEESTDVRTEPQEHEIVTEKLLKEFNFAKASRDEENGHLTPEQVHEFEGVRRESAELSQTVPDVVVERLVDDAEEMDRLFDAQLDEIVELTIDELTGPPESAYKSFREVVNTLLAGGQGAAGRLVALLCYCYRLCKAQLTLSNTVKVVSAIAITGIVAGCLYKYLCEARFFEWLEEIGGWNGLLRELAGGLWDKTFGAMFRGVRYVCTCVGIGYGARAAAASGGRAVVRGAATRGGRAAVRASGEFVDVGRVVARRTTVVMFTRESVVFYFRRATYYAVTSSYRNPALAVGMAGIVGGVALISYFRGNLR